MDEEISYFKDSFHSEIFRNANANDLQIEEAFSEEMGNYLLEYGEMDDFTPCFWMDKHVGARIDGYNWEPSIIEDDDKNLDEEYSTVNLIVALWKDVSKSDSDPHKVTNAEITHAIKRAKKFFEMSMDGRLPGNRIDVGSTGAYDLAKLIHNERSILKNVRIIVITNGIAPQRKGEQYSEDGRHFSINIWDLKRLFNRQKSGAREGIDINFEEYGAPIPCVVEDSGDGTYSTYLSFISGNVLADLYEQHKTRLLEMNVRVFLSQRVNVNKGIRDTIRYEPSMFCAYNNGITVYAKSIETTETTAGHIEIINVNDFQIVNGGQTTASLYHTRLKYKTDLKNIRVQMKLMVIHDGAIPSEEGENELLSNILVPKIGRFSNTQNKIQMSDLRANDPPHPDLFQISQNVPAPDPTGGNIETYWFYEKSRGAWDENKRLAGNTTAQRRNFEAKFPKNQRYDKGLFGKVWYSHLQKPHVVSLGPQKCFAQFNEDFLKEEVVMHGGKAGYWEGFFKQTVGLVMLWNTLYKEIRARIRNGLYGNYGQNITTYTIAWFSHISERRLDTARLWKEQVIPEDLLNYLLELSEIVDKHIADTPMSHVPEWCKKEECWNQLKKKKNPSGPTSLKEYTPHSLQGTTRNPKSSEAEKARDWCAFKPSKDWDILAEFLRKRNAFTGKEWSQCRRMADQIRKQKVTLELSVACKKIGERAVKHYGWKW